MANLGNNLSFNLSEQTLINNSDATAEILNNAIVNLFPRLDISKLLSIEEFFPTTSINNIEAVINNFSLFNQLAVTNVGSLSYNILEQTRNKLPGDRLFGHLTGAVSRQVLEALSTDEMGTSENNFEDTHENMMWFTLSTISRYMNSNSEPLSNPSEFAVKRANRADDIYRGITYEGSEEEKFCYRLGAHLASELTASQEFALMTQHFSLYHPMLYNHLCNEMHNSWNTVNAMTWIDCHKEVEIGHAICAFQAVSIARRGLPPEKLALFDACLEKGFLDFCENRRDFYKELFSQ